jgi:hypothetical protein
VNVILGQPGSGHRHTRLDHSNRTGLPKHGMSWSRTHRRPWPTATTPQSGQPLTFSPVPTRRTRPVPVAVTALTWMPSTPSSASARVHQRPQEQDIELFMSGSLLGLVAWSLPIQRDPDLFPTAPRRTENVQRRGGTFRPP